MTTELAQPRRGRKKTQRRAPGEAWIFATRLAIFWERLWPAALPLLAVPYILIIFSLFGVWRFIPEWLHTITLTLSAAGLAVIAWRELRRLRWPSRREAQARLEEDGRAEHAPLQALDDTPFEGAGRASPLWRAHLEASAERARNARLAGLRATAAAKDPWGLRFTAAGLLAVAMIAAGADWRTRLAAGATPGAGRDATLVADLWIEPPAYTGKPPVYLMRGGERKAASGAQINTPQGARLVAQINGRGRARLSFATGEETLKAGFERKGAAATGELILDQSGLLRLVIGAKDLRWPIGVLADDAPAVGFTQYPEATDKALLAFGFVAEDDYGIASAWLELRLDPDQQRPLDAPAFDEEALAQIRRIEIEAASGERSLALDLQADPWAGLAVLARIVVEDGAGQTGASEDAAVFLPTRTFFNPLAKSVVEQRQTLAVAPSNWPRAGRSLDAVTLAPEAFFDDTTDYLMLRAAFWRVMRQNDDGFEDAVEEFWPLALQLEDKALELARQRLEAAQEALREAIERGASDEEIARLIENLRQAMNEYLAALAQSGQAPGESSRNAEQIDQSDLDEMLDSIRNLAQSGAGNAARQMLSDLENILNNLRLSQGGGGGSGQGRGQPGESEGGASGEAGDLIGRQRELADEAFRRGQTYGENGDDLADQQGALGGDLDDLIDQLQGEGAADPAGDAARALGRARNAMREAEQALENDDFDAATSAMERAIANLRDGAEELVREQMRQARQGENGEDGPGLDPLGRPAGQPDGAGVDVPEETEAGRTRAVIEELRRRLGEPDRSEEEIDYLERLLDRF